MASLLECLFEKQISSDELTLWLRNKYEQISPAAKAVLQEYENTKVDFVPFLLNFLRDQTLHLMQGCRSTSTTPAKTPGSLKLKKWASRSKKQKPNACSTPVSNNRLQLFGGTQENSSAVSLDSFKNLDDTNSPIVSSVNESKNSQKETPTDFHVYRKPKFSSQERDSYSSRSQRNLSFQSQQNSAPRSKQCSLGDFLLSPEANTRQTKQSPHAPRHKDKPSPMQRHKKKPQRVDDSRNSSAVFNLSDFPSMEESLKQPSQAVHVISAPRRITPTTVVTTASDPPSAFFPEPVSHSPIPRSAWASPPEVFRKNLTAGRKVSTPANNAKASRRLNTTMLTQKPTAPKVSPWGTQSTEVNTPQNTQNASPWTGVSKAQDNPMPKTLALTSLTQDIDIGIRSDSPKIASPVKTPKKGLVVTTPTHTPSKAFDRLTSVDIITAIPEEVSFQEQLDHLADVYVGCIAGHLIPSLTLEVYFIMQMLTTRNVQGESPPTSVIEDFDDVVYFNSVHNAVYFAVRVLHLHRKLLCFLDHSMLHLLADSRRIKDFNPSLNAFILELFHANQPRNSCSFFPSPIVGVSFQVETDNRRNFPSERVFHTFKKQRDAFYELLREWQEKHLTPGWSMAEVQGPRISSLLSQSLHLSNHIHFARLFQSQLLQMCKGDASIISDDESNISLLSHLKLTNPEKFKKLQERFTTPSSLGGPCPPPGFPGCQEFFHNFIIYGANHSLNHHLSVTMTAKIVELNQTSFTITETEQKEDRSADLDNAESEALLGCLLSLKLLGKFLGFLTFLPYQTNDAPLPEDMQQMHVSIRNQTCLSLCPLNAVRSALANGRLCLTVPWVVDFLSMMDGLAPQLDSIQSIFHLFLTIHRRSSEEFCRSGSATHLLLITVLGWFFGLSIFPEGLFFQFIPEDLESTTLPPDCLDQLSVIDLHIVYASCPYITEIRNLLLDFSVGISSGASSVRKITPLSAEPSLSSASVAQRNLQAQMEENFFHNQPASLKRTVDFVADRVASNHIKHFKAKIYPDVMARGVKRAQQMASVLEPGSPDHSKRKYLSEIEDHSTELRKESWSLSDASANQFCLKRTKEVLVLLLPAETPATVTQVSSEISCRLARGKISNWLATHITSTVFKRELQAEFEKQMRVRYHAAESNNTSIDQEPKPKQPKPKQPVEGNRLRLLDKLTVNIFIDYKDFVRDLMCQRERFSAAEVVSALERVKYCVCDAPHEDDLSSTLKAFAKLTRELILFAVLEQPELWTPDVMSLSLLLLVALKPHSMFVNIFCPKYLYLPQTSENPIETWQRFEDMLVLVTAKGLLHPKNITHNMLQLSNICHAAKAPIEKVFSCLSSVMTSFLTHHEEDEEDLQTFSQTKLCSSLLELADNSESDVVKSLAKECSQKIVDITKSKELNNNSSLIVDFADDSTFEILKSSSLAAFTDQMSTQIMQSAMLDVKTSV